MQGGDNAGTLAAGLPNITGQMGAPAERRTPTGAFYISGSGVAEGHTYTVASNAFDASRCSQIYGNSETVQPAAITLFAQIKY